MELGRRAGGYQHSGVLHGGEGQVFDRIQLGGAQQGGLLLKGGRGREDGDAGRGASRGGQSALALDVLKDRALAPRGLDDILPVLGGLWSACRAGPLGVSAGKGGAGAGAGRPGSPASGVVRPCSPAPGS